MFHSFPPLRPTSDFRIAAKVGGRHETSVPKGLDSGRRAVFNPSVGTASDKLRMEAVMSSDLTRMSAVEAVKRLKTREITPLDLIDASARRIADVEPAVNALPPCASTAPATMPNGSCQVQAARLPVKRAGLQDFPFPSRT